MKKILIATGVYPPDIGGPATYSKLLHDELPKRGIEAPVLSFGQVRSLPKGVSHLVYFYKLMRMIKTADAVYAQDTISVGIPSALAAFLRKKRFLIRIAGDHAWEQGVQRFGVKDGLDEFALRQSGYHPYVLMLKKLERMVANRAERVVVPSKYMGRIVASWGVSEAKITVIPNPVADVSEQGNRETLRGILHFNGKLLISIGRLVPWKGFDALIETMPALVRKFPDIKLLVVGSGPDLGKLEKLTEDLSLGEHVVFTGALSRDVMLRYLKASDAFVLNTSFESFSFQVVESLWVGVPVITTAVGNLPEFLENNKNALLVTPNDKEALGAAINTILTNATLGKRLAEEGKKTAENFSEEKSIALFLKMIRS